MSTDEVTAYLAEVRERVAPGPDGKVGPSWWIAQNQVYGDDIPRLLAAVEAPLELHAAQIERHGTVCAVCLDAYGESANWPCPTVKEISAALMADPLGYREKRDPGKGEQR